jgi:hypothetical protein
MLVSALAHLLAVTCWFVPSTPEPPRTDSAASSAAAFIKQLADSLDVYAGEALAAAIRPRQQPPSKEYNALYQLVYKSKLPPEATVDSLARLLNALSTEWRAQWLFDEYSNGATTLIPMMVSLARA